MSGSTATTMSRETGIFWDYENVPLPEGCNAAEVTKCIQTAVSKYGRIVERRLYSDSRKWNVGLNFSNRRFLDASGFDLVDTPTRGMKETLDKKMIADVLTFAWDRAMRNDPACVVLVTSDGDYAYTLSKLRDRGVMSVVFYGRACTVAQVLVDTADVALSFEGDVLASIMVETLNMTPSGLPWKSEGAVDAASPALLSSSNAEESDTPTMSHQTRMRPIRSIQTDDLETFCTCVRNVQLLVRKKSAGALTNLSDCWATDLHVGGYFKKAVNSDPEGARQFHDKQRYQNVRSMAISKGSVQAGRRLLNTSFGKKEIVGVTWDENAGKCEGLSTEVYLRLTPQGAAASEKPPRVDERSGAVSDVLATNQGSRIGTSIDIQKSEAEGNDYNTHNETQRSGSEVVSPDYRSTSKSPMTHSQDAINDVTIFCKCVYGIQYNLVTKGSGDVARAWATDASVAESFRKHATKDRYKDVRELAIKDGLVDVGRRNRNSPSLSKEIVPVAWHVNAGKSEGLSDEFYVRLRDKGVAVSKQNIPSNRSGTETISSGGFQGEAGQIIVPMNKGSDLINDSTITQTFVPEHVRFSPSADVNAAMRKNDGQANFADLSAEESDSPVLPPWGTTEMAADVRGAETLSSEEGAQILFQCVKTSQQGSDGWVTDSSVSGSFRTEAAWNLRNVRITGKDYKSARDNAISGGLIEAGRRLDHSSGNYKKIIKVPWHDNGGKREGLASEVYLRVSERRFSKITGELASPTASSDADDSAVHASDVDTGRGQRTESTTIHDAGDTNDGQTHLVDNSMESVPKARVKATSEDIINQDDSMRRSSFIVRNLVSGEHTAVAEADFVEREMPQRIATRKNEEVMGKPRQKETLGPPLSRWSSSVLNVPSADQSLSTSIAPSQASTSVSTDFTPSSALTSTSTVTASSTLTSSIDSNTATKDSNTFLQCITRAHLQVMKKGASGASDSWATDSAVAGLFFEELASIEGKPLNRSTTKQRYKNVRDKTIKEGLVEAGQRRLDSNEKPKQIDKVSWIDSGDKSEHLSPELYLRLTESGGSVVASSQDINFG